MNHWLTPVLLAAGLAGCATAPDLPPDYALDPSGPEGLAIVSLTLSGKAWDKVESFDYRIRPVAAQEEELVSARPYFSSAKQHARWLIDTNGHRAANWNVVVKAPNSDNTPDVTDHGTVHGRVASLPLPAGDYEFYAWKLREPSPYGGTEYSPKQTFSYPFSVRPGQATYIGQINLHLSERNTQRITVEDKRERDLAVLRKKHPSLGTLQMTGDIGRLRP